MARGHGWPVLAHHFKTPEEATSAGSGELPDGVAPTPSKAEARAGKRHPGPPKWARIDTQI